MNSRVLQVILKDQNSSSIMLPITLHVSIGGENEQVVYFIWSEIFARCKWSCTTKDRMTWYSAHDLFSERREKHSSFLLKKQSQYWDEIQIVQLHLSGYFIRETYDLLLWLKRVFSPLPLPWLPAFADATIPLIMYRIHVFMHVSFFVLIPGFSTLESHCACVSHNVHQDNDNRIHK
jgi:hypothetical protein